MPAFLGSPLDQPLLILGEPLWFLSSTSYALGVGLGVGLALGRWGGWTFPSALVAGLMSTWTDGFWLQYHRPPTGGAVAVGEFLSLEPPLAGALLLLSLLFLLYRASCRAAADWGLALAFGLYLLLPLAENFISLYLLLEAANMAVYALLARRWTSDPTLRLEPVLAYFLVNLLGSLLLLLAFGFIYNATGTLSFGELALLQRPSAAGLTLVAGNGLGLGAITLLCGLLLKLGGAPFHFWVAAVYEGLPTHIFVFLQLFPKGALLLLLLALAPQLALSQQPGLEGLLLLLAALNLVWGTVGALAQTSLKRLVIYSSLANLSLPLYALAVGGEGVSGSGVLYTLLYLATTASLLLPLLALAGEGRWRLVELGRGMAPPLRTLVTVAILNLSGVPPFALFFGKVPVALELAERGFLLSLGLLLLASVVAVAYAFPLLGHLWLQGQPAEGRPASAATDLSLLPHLLGAGFLSLGAVANPPPCPTPWEEWRLPAILGSFTHADVALLQLVGVVLLGSIVAMLDLRAAEAEAAAAAGPPPAEGDGGETPPPPAETPPPADPSRERSAEWSKVAERMRAHAECCLRARSREEAEGCHERFGGPTDFDFHAIAAKLNAEAPQPKVETPEAPQPKAETPGAGGPKVLDEKTKEMARAFVECFNRAKTPEEMNTCVAKLLAPPGNGSTPAGPKPAAKTPAEVPAEAPAEAPAKPAAGAPAEPKAPAGESSALVPAEKPAKSYPLCDSHQEWWQQEWGRLTKGTKSYLKCIGHRPAGVPEEATRNPRPCANGDEWNRVLTDYYYKGKIPECFGYKPGELLPVDHWGPAPTLRILELVDSVRRLPPPTSITEAYAFRNEIDYAMARWVMELNLPPDACPMLPKELRELHDRLDNYFMAAHCDELGDSPRIGAASEAPKEEVTVESKVDLYVRATRMVYGDGHYGDDYLLLGLLGVVITGLLGLLLLLARLLGHYPRFGSGGRAPTSAYECGFAPFAGMATSTLFLYYRLAVFFVVFEAELVFLYPWAVALVPAAGGGEFSPSSRRSPSCWPCSTATCGRFGPTPSGSRVGGRRPTPHRPTATRRRPPTLRCPTHFHPTLYPHPNPHAAHRC